MNDNIAEQKLCIKFCVKNEVKVSDTYEMIRKCYGNDTLSQSLLYEWYNCFKNGKESIKEDLNPVRPTTTSSSKNYSNIEKIKSLIVEDPQITIKEIVREVGVNADVIKTILINDLDLKRVSATLIPKTLHFLQKQERIDIVKDMLSYRENDKSFMKRIITGGEIWINEFDMLSSEELISGTSTRGITIKKEYHHEDTEDNSMGMNQSMDKVLLSIFFDNHGIIHQEFLPNGHVMTKEIYLDIILRLHEAIRLKRPEFFLNRTWFLHHDNVPVHNTFNVLRFFAEKAITVIQQPSYSPDLAPCSFFLFNKLKTALYGYSFNGDIELLKMRTYDELIAIRQIDFENCYHQWVKRWHNCIAKDGEYIDNDS